MEIMVLHREHETHRCATFGTFGGNKVPSASFSNTVPDGSVWTVLPSANFSILTPSNDVWTLLPSCHVSMTVPSAFRWVA